MGEIHPVEPEDKVLQHLFAREIEFFSKESRHIKQIVLRFVSIDFFPSPRGVFIAEFSFAKYLFPNPSTDLIRADRRYKKYVFGCYNK
jgi:hypothetical protein